MKSELPGALHMIFDTEETGKVTVRDRDTMEQVTLDIDDISAYIEERLDF